MRAQIWLLAVIVATGILTGYMMMPTQQQQHHHPPIDEEYHATVIAPRVEPPPPKRRIDPCGPHVETSLAYSAGSSCVAADGVNESAWALSVSHSVVPASALLAQARVARDCLLRLKDRHVDGRIGDGGPGDFYFSATLPSAGEQWIAQDPRASALFGMRRAYTPTSVAPSTYLMVLILSGYSTTCVALRAAARETWLRDVRRDVDYRFVMGYPPDDAARDSAKAEADRHGDILFVPHIDAYKNLSVKVAYGMRWAAEATRAQFVAKTDDDVYARLDLIQQWLNKSNASDDLFAGPETVFPVGAKITRTGKWGVPVESYALPKTLWKATNGVLYILGRRRVQFHATEARRVAARGDIACLCNEDLYNGFVNYMYARETTIVKMRASNACKADGLVLGHAHSPGAMYILDSAVRSGKNPCTALRGTRACPDNVVVKSGKESVMADNLRAALNATTMPFFLYAGTLLGYARSCSILPHTTDMDVAAFIDDYDPDLANQMARAGFVLEHTFGSRAQGLELSFRRRDIKLDIFFVYPDVATRAVANASGGIVRAGATVRYAALWKGTLMRKMFDPVCPIVGARFLNLSVRIPECVERHMVWSYGSQWRVPVVDGAYNWWSSRMNTWETIDTSQ